MTVRESFEFVSVAEAAVRLGVSPTTIRDRIRAGQLEAERVARPQGSIYLVRLPKDEQPMIVDEQSRTDDERPRAELEAITTLAASLVEQAGRSTALLVEQAQQIGRLVAERDREQRNAYELGATLELERQRADDASARADELAAVVAKMAPRVAELERQLADATRRRRWWRFWE